ncbi:hypothetical protein [Deferribacter desulfuricans]|uniref:hypothetical protein n=1 Tax=Deferribacter desulfuricans TaxID=197162 RepID=UPI00059B6C1A|nr:hypothetical protein [Deferribacter desulfuricans]
MFFLSNLSIAAECWTKLPEKERAVKKSAIRMLHYCTLGKIQDTKACNKRKKLVIRNVSRAGVPALTKYYAEKCYDVCMNPDLFVNVMIEVIDLDFGEKFNIKFK